VKCQWFHGCVNTATTTREHKTLGDVPLCEKCDAWRDEVGVTGDMPPMVAKHYPRVIAALADLENLP
jgi:hypothetical protein